MKADLNLAFEELKYAVHQLQSDLAKGDTQSVADGLGECLAALEELQKVVVQLVPDDK